VVDPIDGTVNFLYDLPQYAVSIAATRDGVSEAGVVVNVASGEVFEATLGGGASLDGRPLRVREVVPMGQRLVGTGFNYVQEVRQLQAVAVGRMLGSVRDVRRLGSAALDLCAVAAGRLDAYVEEGLNAWDLAAGGLVAAEAGARVESLRGVGGTTCVVAAPAGGFAEFLTLVEDCGFLAAGGE
jgi:myo-inositol-1(or 4)-monophosphatase